MRSFLDQMLMKKMTSISAGGELQHKQLEQSTRLAKQKKAHKLKKKPLADLIPDKNSLHEAHYFLMKTYVDGEQNDSDSDSD